MPDPLNDTTSNSGAERLHSFVERIERLDAEAKDIADARKEVLSEAKGEGYLVMAIRKIVAERKRKPEDVAEEQALLEMYRSALGMA
jgi:uncharacterized protein (UPF0335 family)